MTYSIKWEEKVLRELGKLEKGISYRIFKKVDELRDNFSSLDIKKIKGEDRYRLRVGDYRVIFSIQKDFIVIWKVGHRKNIYSRN